MRKIGSIVRTEKILSKEYNRLKNILQKDIFDEVFARFKTLLVGSLI